MTALLLLAAACGGAASPQDYFTDLGNETRAYNEAVAELRQGYADDLADELASLQDGTDFTDTEAVNAYFSQAKEVAIVKTADLFTDTGAALRQMLDALDALEPPEALVPAHQDAVASGEALAAALPITIESVRNLDSVEALHETIEGSPFAVAAQRFVIACQNLEAAATGAGIEVELDCPDGIEGAAQ